MVHIVMLGFNTHGMIREAMDSFNDTSIKESVDVHKWFFDVGYPGNDSKTLEIICGHHQYKWTYNKFENEGVLGNWNKVIHEYLNMQPGDFLVTFDPDVRMQQKGWISAMVEALESDPTAMFCSSALDFHHHDWMQQPPYNRKVTTLESGLRISRYDCLIAWASGMWRADFLITRPRNFGARGKWYGWNDHADYERLLAHGYTWLSTTDFVDHHLGSPDPKYVEWKQKTAGGIIEKKFEDWIKDGN